MSSERQRQVEYAGPDPARRKLQSELQDLECSSEYCSEQGQERTKGNRVQHLHRIWNITYSHQPDWKNLMVHRSLEKVHRTVLTQPWGIISPTRRTASVLANKS